MKALPLILLAAACGSSSKPPAQPAPATPAEPTVVEPVAKTEPPPAPVAKTEAPPPAPPPPPVPVYERLHDPAGPVPGLAGFALAHAPSENHCGGTKVTTKRAKKPAAADKQIVAVYALEFPTGLDFDPDPAKKKVKNASVKKFDDFVKQLTTTGGEAAQFYTDQTMSTNTTTDEAGKLAAMARYVQIQFRVVAVLARGEIPKDVRTGEFKTEKTAAFCEKMSEVSEPLLERAETALKLCQEKVKASTLTGWWNEVCGPR